MSTPAPTTATPTCHARNCDVEVPRAMFMCHPHWFMVPPPLREAIKATYRPDQQPSGEYQDLARAAIDAVAHKEARSAPRKPIPRTPRKPVQLALFDLS